MLYTYTYNDDVVINLQLIGTGCEQLEYKYILWNLWSSLDVKIVIGYHPHLSLTRGIFAMKSYDIFLGDRHTHASAHRIFAI